MKYVWNGKNRIVPSCLSLVLLLSVWGCDNAPEKPGEGFYSYSGYRDWYRVPLTFPYQLIMIDDLDLASIEKYDPSKLIADPNESSKRLVSKVTHIIHTKKFATFRQNTGLAKGESWGILIYGSEKIQYFKNKKDFSAFMEQNYPEIKLPQWESTQTYYFRVWKGLDKQRRQRNHLNMKTRIWVPHKFEKFLAAKALSVGKRLRDIWRSAPKLIYCQILTRVFTATPE